MRLDHPTGNGQPKSGSGVGRAAFGLSSPTDLKDTCQVVVLDTSTLVGYGETRPAVRCPPRADQNLPVLLGVTHRVTNEIGQGPRKLLSIALHRKAIGVVGHIQDEVDIAPPGMLARLTHDVVGQFDQAQRAALLGWLSRSSIEP